MKKIPLIRPRINQKKLFRDIKLILKSGILTRGKFVAAFEKKLADFLNVKYVFATTSCTTALHLGLVALDIKEGDEVLVSDFSFPATGNVIVQVGAKPVFVDIDLESFNINLDDLKQKITPETKAIMVVHAFGYPANMSEIMKIAKSHKLFVIEDAACAIGSKHKDKYCGVWGDVGCFSFHPRKVITTGEGGAIVTNHLEIAKKIEILRNHGGVKNKRGFSDFIEAGFNYRLTEIQAAIGAEQMSQLKKINLGRQKVAQRYLKLLKDVPDLILPQEPKDGKFNFQSFVIILPQDIDRAKIIKALSENGIETTLGTYAMHAQASFKRFGYRPGQLPNSFFAYEYTLTLPLYGDLKDKKLRYIVKNLKDIIKREKNG